MEIEDDFKQLVAEIRRNTIDECIEKLYEMTPYSHEQRLDMVYVSALKQLKGEQNDI